MPEPTKILLIEDYKPAQDAMKMLAPTYGMSLVVASTIKDAIKAVDAGHFNAIISDVSLGETLPGFPTPIEFLKLCEMRFPRTHLAVHTGLIKPDKPYSGITFIKKGTGDGLFDFLELVEKNPWKKPGQKKINLDQYLRPVMHTTATGKKELVSLVHANFHDLHFLNRIRQGWRPKTMQQAMADLRREIETLPTRAEREKVWKYLHEMRKAASKNKKSPVSRKKIR